MTALGMGSFLLRLKLRPPVRSQRDTNNKQGDNAGGLCCALARQIRDNRYVLRTLVQFWGMREVAVRRIRYAVAMSLDGFIAGPNGEADWIIMDPEIDFKEIYSQFDTMLIGRRVFEGVNGAGGAGLTPSMQVYVCSRTLRQEDHPAVTITAEPEAVISGL